MFSKILKGITGALRVARLSLSTLLFIRRHENNTPCSTETPSNAEKAGISNRTSFTLYVEVTWPKLGISLNLERLMKWSQNVELPNKTY